MSHTLPLLELSISRQPLFQIVGRRVNGSLFRLDK